MVEPYSAPERLWLQWIPDTRYGGDVTWCSDKINDDDVEYVRLDQVPTAPELEERIEELETAAKEEKAFRLAVVLERDKLEAKVAELEANIRVMVDKAAAKSLDGYRDLGARAAAAENERDKLEAKVAELEAYRRTPSEMAAALQREEERHLETARELEEAEAKVEELTAERRRLREALEELGTSGALIFHDTAEAKVEELEAELERRERVTAEHLGELVGELGINPPGEDVMAHWPELLEAVAELAAERDDLRDLAERRKWGAEELDRVRADRRRLLEALADVVNQACQNRYDSATGAVYVDDRSLSAYEDAFAVLDAHGLLEPVTRHGIAGECRLAWPSSAASAETPLENSGG